MRDLQPSEDVNGLTCTIGRLHFAWAGGSADIEVYSVTEDGRPDLRIGFLSPTVPGGDALRIDETQEASENHWQCSSKAAATAKIIVVDDDPPATADRGVLPHRFNRADPFPTAKRKIVENLGAIADFCRRRGDEYGEYPLGLGELADEIDRFAEEVGR